MNSSGCVLLGSYSNIVSDLAIRYFSLYPLEATTDLLSVTVDYPALPISSHKWHHITPWCYMSFIQHNDPEIFMLLWIY
jgi:hypothetical protein